MDIRQFFKIKVFILIFIFALIGSFYLAHRIYKQNQIESFHAFFKEEEKIAQDVFKNLSNEPKPEMNLEKKKIKVLVVEGGGVKGLYAIRVLDYLEKKTGKPISELYDVMGGTSVGSMIVSLLSVPDQGKPKYSAEDLISLFPSAAQKTLVPSFKQKILSGFSLLTPIVNNQKFIQLLRTYFGDIPFSKALNHLVLFGYNFSTTKIQAFHNRGNYLDSANPLLYQILGGTTAFFGIIPPNKVLLSPYYSSQFIGDSALAHGNPVEPMMLDVIKMYPDKKFIVTYIAISPRKLGDTVNFPFFSGKIKAMSMANALINTADNELVRESMNSLNNVFKFDLLLEIRINQNNEWAKMNSFDFSFANFRRVDEFSKLLLQQNKKTLDLVAEELLRD
jgi:hypothetical protein